MGGQLREVLLTPLVIYIKATFHVIYILNAIYIQCCVYIS